MKKEHVIQQLQGLVDQILPASQNHEIHSNIFLAQGFVKLGDKYKAHAQEERDFAVKLMNRIIDLGGKVEHNASESMPVYEDVREYLAHEAKVQAAGVAVLAECLQSQQFDITSYELLKEYYIDEEEDLFWMEQQLELIDRIGYENYLIQQL